MSSRAAIVLAAALVFCAAACIANDDGNPAQQKQAVLSAVVAPAEGLVVAPGVVHPKEFLVYVGDTPVLPRHKTEWEKRIDRLRGQAKAGKISFADQFDDYRKNNFDKFFITKPPTTTTIRGPAEYEQSQAYLLNWYQSSSTLNNQMYGQIVKGAWGIVPVLMIYNNAAHKLWIEGQLTSLGYTAAEMQDPNNIIWWQHATNANWARDYGPLSIVSTGATPTLSLVDFRYYHERIYDDEIPSDLAKDWGINVFRPDLDFEGGNFMNTTDGLCAQSTGTLYYNPQFTQSAIEDIFKQYMACKQFVWPTPLSGTIAHIDMFAKFGSDTTMMVAEYTAAQDATNKPILDANATLFASTTTPSGKTFTVTRIPMANKGGSGSGAYVRTYTNSVSLMGATQKVVLVPVYAQETSNEAAAMAAYATVFPGWTFAKVTSDVIIPLSGATHCITMQIPAGAKAKMEADPGDLCGPQALSCTTLPTCGNITAAGCCQGSTLKYCDGGKLVSMDCTANPQCGWNATQSWYDCGTAGTADPSGTYVMNCDAVTDAAPIDPCGGVTYEGCCDGEVLYYCENNQLVTIDCTQGPSCGWQPSGPYYDCGTDGSADPSGQFPKACVWGDGGPPKTDAKVTDSGPGCGGIAYEGCCDGETLKYCDNGVLKTIDCSNNPSCGWLTGSNFYDCGTDGSADPSGTFPKQCGTPAADASPDQPVAQPDMPWLPDQQAQADQTVTQPDGAAKTDGGDDGGGGCGCRVASTPDRTALPLLLLGLMLGLALVGRERRR
jgi:agmatine deiminase